MNAEQLWNLATQHKEAMLDFCQRLIQTPSLPGEEGDLAELVMAEMRKLDYDRVWADSVGNIVGLIQGRQGKSVMFNSHLDHVSPGDLSLWPHPPYEGYRDEAFVWGRGASDVKGALATQVYALGALKGAGLTPAGDCYFTGVVMEEIGGLGTRRLLDTLKTDWAIVGEATENNLARGHRGRYEFIVRILGRSVHASVPQRGINPHYSMARFLTSLRELPMSEHATFGPASVAPTLSGTDQTSGNVIPREVYMHLDWRAIPGQTADEVQAQLQALLDQSLVDGSQGAVELRHRQGTTYTGYEEAYPFVSSSFELEAQHPLVTGAHDVLEQAFRRPVHVDTWNFTTDGGHLVAAGIPTIGFAPGAEAYCHTVEDRISIELMVEALVGNMALALELGS